jgi:Fe-S cluster biogenesis protein NfuA
MPYSLSAPASFSEKECAEALADALIRPILGKDNGGICIHNINNRVMELSFTGHCSGCPYAQNTLQNVVSKTFLRYLPQIKEIKLREAE